MKENKILTKYLFPMMIQIILIALAAVIFSMNGIVLGYESIIGIVLIVMAGISSALWGVLYQCKYNNNRFWKIIKDFFDIRQSIKSYLFVIIFLLIDFGGVIISKGFRIESIGVIILLFLKAIVFGGIEEIGWRYTFQPAMERKFGYIPAVFITFVCWGIWHFLFFYIDGSIANVNGLFFLLGLLTNCFVLSALYAYSGSLWICVMTHALINSFSQITVKDNVIISIISKILCMVIALTMTARSGSTDDMKNR